MKINRDYMEYVIILFAIGLAVWVVVGLLSKQVSGMCNKTELTLEQREFCDKYNGN